MQFMINVDGGRVCNEHRFELTWSTSPFNVERYGEGYVAKMWAVAFGPVTVNTPPVYFINASVKDIKGLPLM